MWFVEHADTRRIVIEPDGNRRSANTNADTTPNTDTNSRTGCVRCDLVTQRR